MMTGPLGWLEGAMLLQVSDQDPAEGQAEALFERGGGPCGQVGGDAAPDPPEAEEADAHTVVVRFLTHGYWRAAESRSWLMSHS